MKKHFLYGLLVLSVFFQHSIVLAAPDITHPTQTICKGSSATLSTTTKGDKYEWSPSTGLSATDKQSVTAKPTQEITYTCKVTQKGGSYDTGNLISIGGFEFMPSFDRMNSEAKNKMGDMIKYEYPSFQTSGAISYGESTTTMNTSTMPSHSHQFYELTPHSGSYFLVCDGGQKRDVIIWSATGIKLQKGVTYQFSCWAANVFIHQKKGEQKTCSNIKFMIKKGSGATETLATITTSSTPGVWNEYTNAKFTADNDYSNCTIYIVNDNLEPDGNDFALDDIYFGTEIRTEDEVTNEIFKIKIDEPATATITDQTICAGDPVTVTAKITGTYDKISWTKNGSPITGSTESVSGTAPANVGSSDTYTISVKTGVCPAEPASGKVTAKDCGTETDWEVYKCYNTKYDLTAKTSGGSKYEWKTASGTVLPTTTQTLPIESVKPEKYICVVTKPNGSTVTENIELKVYPQYTLTFGDENGNPLTECSDETGLKLYVGFAITPNPCDLTQGCDESGTTYTVIWTKNGAEQDPAKFIKGAGKSYITDITAPSQPGNTDDYTFTYRNNKDNSCSWTAHTSVTAKNCSNPPIPHTETACEGDEVTLTPDTEGDSYSWSDGESILGTNRSLVIKDVEPGVKKYTCTVTTTTPATLTNLIPNGDFEDVSTACPYPGFTSDYKCFGLDAHFDHSLSFRGFMRVSSISFLAKQSPHSGSYMLEIDGDKVANNKKFWHTSVSGTFKKGEVMKLSFWGSMDHPNNPVKIALHIKYGNTDEMAQQSTIQLGWKEYSSQYTLKEDCSVIELYMIDLTAEDEGNDCVIDDIFMTSASKPAIQDEIFTLTVNPKLEKKISDTVHKGNAYNKNGFNIPASEITATGQITKEITVPSKVTGCDSTTILTLNVYDTKEVTVCYGSEQTFESLTSGDSYQWNIVGKDGSDKKSITIDADVFDLACMVTFPDGSFVIDTIFINAYVYPGIGTTDHSEECAGTKAELTINLNPTPTDYAKSKRYLWNPQHQWSLNGTNIPGATTTTLSDAEFPMTVGSENTYAVRTDNGTDNGTCNSTSSFILKAKKCEPKPIEHTITECQAEGKTITIEPQTTGDSYLWSDGTTEKTNTVDISTAGTFELSCTVTIGDDVTVPITRQVENFTIVVNPILYETITDKVCQGKPFNKYGFNIPASETAETGVIEKTLTTTSVVTECDSVVTLKLTVFPVKESSLEGETCQGESFSKDGFTFSSAETANIGTISKTRVEKTKECGCDSTITFYLNINENPQFSTNVDGKIVVITTTKGVSPFTYTIDNHKIYTTETITDLGVGTHSILVTDAKTCKASDSFEILPVPIEPMVYFTPNDDGMNDLWLVKGIDFYPTAIIQIFDRFSKLLFTYKASDFNGWDGVYNGHPMPMTDYWYVITVEELNKTLSGHFTLKR